MNLLTLLMLLVLGITIGFVIITFQVIGLARIYRGKSWLILAGTFILLAGRQIYGLLKLPSTILNGYLKAASAGVTREQIEAMVPSSLSFDQWLSVVWIYVIIGGFILGLDWMRRDLRSLGI